MPFSLDEWLEPLLTKVHNSWKIILVSFLVLATGILTLRYYTEYKFTTNSPQCNGTFQNPNDTTFYRFERMESIVDDYDRLEHILVNEMPELYNRSHTIIFNCPFRVEPLSFNFTIFYHAFIQSLVLFNQENNPPINFWLRLDKRSNVPGDFNFCTDIAALGNKILPGTVQGILANSEIVLGVASTLSLFRGGYDIKDNSQPCTFYTPECFEVLKVQGLKFGLMMNPVTCEKFPTVVMHQIISKFGEIFYFDEKERAELIIGEDKVPTLTVSSSDFGRCKKHLAESVPDAKELKYVIAEKYQVHQPWENSPYPYCLNFV